MNSHILFHGEKNIALLFLGGGGGLSLQLWKHLDYFYKNFFKTSVLAQIQQNLAQQNIEKYFGVGWGAKYERLICLERPKLKQKYFLTWQYDLSVEIQPCLFFPPLELT